MAVAALSVTCIHCSHDFRVKPEAAGRSVKCPKCRNRTPVDGDSSDDGGDPDTDPEMGWLGLGELTQSDHTPAEPPRAIAASSVPEPPRPLRHRDQNGEPRPWKMLRGLRVTYFGLAGIAVLLWLLTSIHAVRAIASAESAKTAEYPADVPAGADRDDPGLTPEQRLKLSAYEMQKSMEELAGSVVTETSKMILITATLGMIVSVTFFLTLAGAIELGVQVQDDTRRAALYASRLPLN